MCCCCCRCGSQSPLPKWTSTESTRRRLPLSLAHLLCTIHFIFYYFIFYFFLNGILLDRWQRSFDVPFKDALGGGYRIPSSHFLLFVKEKKKGRAQFGMFEICHLENQLPIWNNRNFFIVFAQRLVIKRHSPFIDVRYTQKRNVKHFLLATAK